MNRCKPPPFRFTRGAFLLAAALHAPLVHAGEAHLGANTVATGGAFAGLPKDNSAVTGAPGALALAERYDGMGFASLGPSLDYRLGASAVDSRTGPVAMGLAYRRSQNNLPVTEDDLPGWVIRGEPPSNKEFGNEFTIALGFATADRVFAVGANTTLLWWRRERRGRGFSGNADLGIGFAPHELVSGTLTGRNLLFMLEDEDMPLGGVLGLRVGDLEKVHGLLDVEVTDAWGPSIRAGVDGSAGPSRLRAGYAWDGQLEQHQVTWGLGVENTAGGFEYAMRIPVTNNRHGFSGLLHTLSIRVFPPPLEIEETR